MKIRSVYGTILCLTMLFSFLTSTVWIPHSMAKKATIQETSREGESLSGDYLHPGLLASRSDLRHQDMILIDARHPDDYRAGHIPGAIHLWWKDLGDPNILSIPQLDKILGQKGLSRERKMVVYDNAQSSEGAAGRIFWILEYLGCKNVSILNGGSKKWLADGNPMEKRINSLPCTVFSAKLEPKRLAKKEFIADRIHHDDFALIDARTDEEYNGWALHGEKRGGHIKNAISINYKWLFNETGTIRDYPALKDLMESHGVTTDKEISVYGTCGVRSAMVYFALRLMGYPKCSNYDRSLMEWSDDATLPMETMPRYEKLVYAGWVDALIKGGNPGKPDHPPTYPGKGYVIIHASSLYWKGAANPRGYNPHGDYESGHIPGAISIPLHHFDVTQKQGIYPWTKPEDGNLLPPEQLKAVIESYGIKHDHTVVVYCGNKSYVGGAYRVAWALMYAGVKDVRYLNGDLAAWVENGGTLETKFNIPRPVPDFGRSVPAHPEYLATTKQVEDMCSGDNAVIADDRSWTEFSAKDKAGCYYEFFCSPGHIPKAVWVHDMYWYLDDFSSWRKPGYYKPASLKSYSIIKKEWEKRGVTPDKKIAFYCGGGWRSSLVWYYAYLMGYPTISNYDGGWYEWTWDPNRPVEVGGSGEIQQVGR